MSTEVKSPLRVVHFAGFGSDGLEIRIVGFKSSESTIDFLKKIVLLLRAEENGNR